VAVKCISSARCSEAEMDQIHFEIEIMLTLNHPNIIKCLGIYHVDKNQRDFRLVLEYMEGGTVLSLLQEKGELEENLIISILRDTLYAVNYLHGIHIVHRDIKLDNLLLSYKSSSNGFSGEGMPIVKLCDFGLSSYATRDSLTDPAGTPTYVSPEVLNRKAYGKSVDMWALGIVAYALIAGYFPFDHPNPTTMARKIKKGDYNFNNERWEKISKLTKNFISNLLIVDPMVPF